MLTTFERSWICKVKYDDNGKALADMEITKPYATSPLGQNLYQDIERHSLFQVIFALFSLTHTSDNRFKISNSNEFLELPHDKDYDDNNDDNENDDHDVKDPNFKPTRTTTSNSVISLPATRSRSGVSGTTKKSLLPIELVQMTPPNSTSHSTSHSTSPLSDMDLPIPDFSHVNSLKIWPWEQGFLAEGRCGQVFIGVVNGIRAAVKVSFSIFLI